MFVKPWLGYVCSYCTHMAHWNGLFTNKDPTISKQMDERTKRINKQVRLGDRVREISLSVCELLFIFFRLFLKRESDWVRARWCKGQKRVDNVLLSLYNYNKRLCVKRAFAVDILRKKFCPLFTVLRWIYLYNILILIIAIQTLIRTL